MGHFRTRKRMPLSAYALFISYIIKAIFSNQIGLEIIMSYMYIYK